MPRKLRNLNGHIPNGKRQAGQPSKWSKTPAVNTRRMQAHLNQAAGKAPLNEKFLGQPPKEKLPAVVCRNLAFIAIVTNAMVGLLSLVGYQFFPKWASRWRPTAPEWRADRMSSIHWLCGTSRMHSTPLLSFYQHWNGNSRSESKDKTYRSRCCCARTVLHCWTTLYCCHEIGSNSKIQGHRERQASTSGWESSPLGFKAFCGGGCQVWMWKQGHVESQPRTIL